MKKAPWFVFALMASLLAPRSAHAQSSAGSPGLIAVATAATDSNYPYIIPVETWLAQGGFRRGDMITIRLVRGDRPRIEPGGTYLVQGTYVLRSAPEATLALSLTSSANGGRGQWAETQRQKVGGGDGSFSLIAPMKARGEFHVSFYIPDPQNPNRSSAEGGVYFDNR